MVAVPVGALLATMGWVGQKVLNIDEVQQQHAALIADTIETQTKWIERGVQWDERLVRAETLVDDLKEEQRALRERLREMNINTRFRQTKSE